MMSLFALSHSGGVLFPFVHGYAATKQDTENRNVKSADVTSLLRPIWSEKHIPES